jgi:hypothetical protein
MKLAQYVLPLLLLARAVPAADAVPTADPVPAADAVPTADPVPTDYFPPETKVVFGIRIHNILASSLVRGFMAGAQAAGADWLKQVSLPGFDPLRDIDEVLIASSGEGQKPPALLVLSGRFDVAHLAAGARRYHDVPLLGGGKEGDGAMALLDGSTAIAGDLALVRAAIDRRDQSLKIDTALADRIASLRQRYDVWGLGERAGGFVSPAPEAEGLESIDRFQFGMLLGNGLDLGAEIHACSPQDAGKLRAALEEISAILKTPQLSGSATRFDLQVEEGTLKLTLAIPEEELQKIIEVERVSQAMARTDVAAAPAVVPEPAVRTPPPAIPGATPKPAAAQVLDKEGNTVILQLPGKK